MVYNIDKWICPEKSKMIEKIKGNLLALMTILFFKWPRFKDMVFYFLFSESNHSNKFWCECI